MIPLLYFPTLEVSEGINSQKQEVCDHNLWNEILGDVWEEVGL